MNAHRSQAPAFQLEVRAPFFWRFAHGLAWSLAWLATSAAVIAQAEVQVGVMPGIAIAALLLLPLPLVCMWARRADVGPGAQLLWDGRSFAWREGTAVGAPANDAERRAVQVAVVLDVGGFLLLRCSSSGPDAAPRPPESRLAVPGMVGGSFEQAWRRVLAGLARLVVAAKSGDSRRSLFLPLLQSQHPGVWLKLRWALFSARRLPPAQA